jgi:hypothetical protein
MKNSNPFAPFMHENHKKPLTRRELLAQGFISYGGYLALPSVLTMFSRQARGEDSVCTPQKGGARMIPVIVFDLAGGANLSGVNVIAGAQGGQMDFLPPGSYGTIGLAPEAEPSKLAATDPAFSEFGLAFHPASPMLAGMRATTTAPTRAGVEGVMFAGTSNDDSRSNPHNPLYWVAKAGSTGDLVSFVGTSSGASGGRAPAPAASIDPSKAPTVITKPGDALGIVDAGKLANLLGAVSTPQQGIADVQKVLQATRSMSEARIKKFQQKDVPAQVQELIKCGYINSAGFLSKFTPAALDPNADPIITARFTMTNAQQANVATITKLVLDGYAGAGVIEMGGYDYHGQGRATQNTKDTAVGDLIGRVLETAALKQTPVMIYVYTDGGVSSNAGGSPTNGLLPFTSDSGERSSSFALLYKPGGARPAMRNNKHQIGAFQASGSVDTTASKIANTPELMTKAFIANYLAAHGREGDLAKVVGDNPFGAELEKHLAFAKNV